MKKRPKIDPADVPELKKVFFQWLQAEQDARNARQKAEYFKALHESQLKDYLDRQPV